MTDLRTKPDVACWLCRTATPHTEHEHYEGTCECGYETVSPEAFDAHIFAICNLSKDRGTK